MLTKEECLEALTEIKMYGSISIPLYSLEVIENLIDEHFDNPPLKFDELEENMWVWDNKRKVKLLIAYCYSEDDMGYYNLSNPEDYKYVHIEFEENRFYRKEVQE